MKINTKVTNFQLTDDVSAYLVKKIGTFEKLIDEKKTEAFCEIEIGKSTNHHKSGDIFRAEINLRAGGKYFRAVSERDSINVAIDEVKDEITAELKSYKNKRATLLRRGGAKIKNLIKGFYNPFRKSR